MRDSVLHLEGYYVRELSVTLNEGFADKRPFGNWSGYHYWSDKSPKIEPSQFRVRSEVGQRLDDPSRWRYELTIRSSGRKDATPYTFSISLVGYFHVHAEGVEDNASEEMIILVNAPSVLFSAAREALASATARGPYPAVVLPLVSFLDDAEEMAADKAKRVVPRRAAISLKAGATKQRAKKAAKKK
jgi:preprotein translocase subunit SecB